MARKIDIPNLHDLIARQISGESVTDLARELGIDRTGLARKMAAAGHQPIHHAYSAVFDPARAVALYRDGQSVRAIAAAMGCDTTRVRRALVADGVAIRSQSETIHLAWCAMPSEQRDAMAARVRENQATAIAALKGKARSPQHLSALASAKGRPVSPSENDMATALHKAGCVVEQQRPVLSYNLDIAVLHPCRIAVEVFDSVPGSQTKSRSRQRHKDISGAGYFVIYLMFHWMPRVPDIAAVAQKVVTFADAVSRLQPSDGHYGMVGCHGEPVPGRRLNLHQFPRVAGF